MRRFCEARAACCVAAARLAKFHVLRLGEFRDSLPKAPTQRVEKYELREESGGGGPMVGKVSRSRMSTDRLS